jgi:hypothetical protein
MKGKTFILSLLLSVILLCVCINAGTAHADAILFPWIVKNNTVSTIISVVNTAGIAIPGIFQNSLHYQYYYKETTANQNTEVCDQLNFVRSTSANDIVTFDASGLNIVNNGKPLYNDPGPYYDEKFNLTVADPRRAFLIVDNNTAEFVEDDENVDGSLYGEALLMDHVTGLIWGYTAYNARLLGKADLMNDQVSFRDGHDYQGQVIGSTEAGWTVLQPPEEFFTRYYVTPIGLYGQRYEDINTRVYLSYTEEGGTDRGLFDIDENPIDFHRTMNIVCTGVLDLSDLISAGAYDHFISTGGHGWTYVKTETGTAEQSDNPSSQAVIGKLEWKSFVKSVVVDLSETDDCISCKEDCLERCLNPKNPKPFITFKCNRQCYKLCQHQCYVKKSVNLFSGNFTWIRSGESLPPPIIRDEQ